MLIALARNNLSLAATTAPLTGTPEALFMVEFSGDDFGYVTDRIKKLQAKLQGVPGVIATLPAIEATARQPLWNLRNAAMPLLLGMPGDRKPTTFIEDTAVAPEHLPRLRRPLPRHPEKARDRRRFLWPRQRRLPAHSAACSISRTRSK